MQSGNHAPSFASDLPCPRSDIYSYSESYSYSYSDGVRWHLPAVHLARKSRESVPGVLSRRPPGTETPQKRSRCHFSPSTWHGFPTKACQVSFPCRPPGTESPRKRSRWHLPASTWHGIPAKAFQVSFPAVHLVRNLRESVPGVFSRLPPATEFLQKRSRWHLPAVHLARNSCKSVPGGISLPSTWHGIPAKVFQVALLVVHLPRYLCESVPGGISPLPTCHGFPVKEFQVAPLVVHLARKARNPRESVPGGISLSSTWHGFPTKACQVSFPCRPPGTESPRKRVRCLIPPSTWHGNPAKAWQVSLLAFHLARNSRESVPGVLSRRPPGTETPQKCSRCLFPPSTCHGGSSHHGMLWFFSRAYGCFQHEACNHQHTCSCGIHASF